MTATKQQPIAGYRISDPSDPELGFWFSETPCAEGYLSEPLYAGAAPAAVAGPALDVRAIAAAVCQRVAELPDRDSPEDWPEAMLVTGQELIDAVADEIEQALAQAAPALEAPAAPDLRKTRDKAGILHYLTPEQMAEEIVRLDARLAAAPQAPAAPSAYSADLLAALGQWHQRCEVMGAHHTLTEAQIAELVVAGLLRRAHGGQVITTAGRAALAAPAAPAVDAWLQPDDMAALQRFHETAEDDESYDIGKEAVARLCAFGCLQSHSFGRYSTTDFGDYLLDTWAGARTLPFTTAAEREARAAQAKEGGA